MSSSTNPFSLEGKNALVTGSSRGLGFSIAEGLAEAGARVVLNDIDEARLDAAYEAFKARGFAVEAQQMDVVDRESLARGAEEITRKVGALDILVNNVGIQIRGPLEEMEEEVWAKVLRLNLDSVFLVSKAFVKPMIERRAGKIINICSLLSEVGRPTIAPYTASKGGVKMLTKAMATEWGKHNIQTNGIGPGYFLTEMTKTLAEDEKFDSWIKGRTPAARWGLPEELKGTAVFLSSAASDFVNGQVIYVDGGILAAL